jgi:hypothetical protein
VPTRTPKAGFVYLIGPLQGCVKIGQSTDPNERTFTIGTLPSELAVLASIPSADVRWLESYLHRCYAAKRVRGEWFGLSDADVDFLSRIVRADSLADLPPALVALHDAETKTTRAVRNSDLTTWKARQDVARTLRLIAAYLDLKQEDTLELFLPAFEERLEQLRAADAERLAAKRKE